MIRLTKIFHFEMAHAIHDYPGACKNIHGHSYELHVTLGTMDQEDDYLPAPGFQIDFKGIKQMVKNLIIEKFDHRLILSSAYLSAHPDVASLENLIQWDHEPTAENLLTYIQKTIRTALPKDTQLLLLKLYETKDSFAEWLPDSN